MINILMDIVREDMVDLGARGELVARALLTSAYDRAVEREQSNTNTTPFFSRGCDMINFIKELFVEDCAEEILGSVPDNVKNNTSFGEAFKSAKIRFTQFVKAVDNICTTSEAMYAAFIRGVAIICATSQEGVDIMIPVLVKDSALCEDVMTSFMIQVKRRVINDSIAAYIMDEAAVGLFPTGSKGRSDTRPYITLVMELGVQPPLNPKAKTPAKVRNRPKPKFPSLLAESQHMDMDEAEPRTPSKVVLPRQGRLRHSTATHPRYNIFAYGCSNTVYKAIDHDKYAFLLASHDILEKHTHQDIECLDAVRRMDLFWATGKACFDWLEGCELLNEAEEVDSADGAWLVAGTINEEEKENAESQDDHMSSFEFGHDESSCFYFSATGFLSPSEKTKYTRLITQILSSLSRSPH